MATATNNKDGAFWTSRKFWYVVLGVVAVVTLTLVGTAIGVSDEARDKAVEGILALVGILVGAHAVTDVGSQVSSAVVSRREKDE